MLLPLLNECNSCEAALKDGTIKTPALSQEAGVISVGIPTRLSDFGSSHPLPFLIVGQNPGRQENDTGLCFVGPTGQTVHNALIQGISLHEHRTIYLTNVARCFHGFNRDGPTQAQYRKCAQAHLPHDIHAICRLHGVTELPVLCLGGPATKEIFWLCDQKVTLKEGFSRQGTLIPLSEKHQCPTFPTPSGTASSKTSTPRSSMATTAKNPLTSTPRPSATSPLSTPSNSGEPSAPPTSVAGSTRTGQNTLSDGPPAARDGGPTQQPNLRIFSTYHPAAVMRNQNLKYAVADHLQLVQNHIHGITPDPVPINLQYIEGPPHL